MERTLQTAPGAQVIGFAPTEPSRERQELTEVADTRAERDSMGEMQVPASAYYGASTQRAVENFLDLRPAGSRGR